MTSSPNGRVLETISLFLSAKGLVLKGIFSSGNPNPFAVIFRTEEFCNARVALGVTEPKADTSSADWTTNFSVEYNFERNETYEIEVYHQNGNIPPTDTSKHTLLGKVEFVLSNLMRAPSQVLMLPISGYERAQVHVKAEIQANTRDNFVASFSCSKLCNKEGFFSTSDPFLEISRLNEDGSYSVVWRNDHIDNSLNPKWAQAKIPMVTLCNADIDRPLRITIWDWEKNNKHKFMGKVDTSVREMIISNGGNLNVIEPDKQKKSSYKNSGTLSAGACFIEQNPTFGDYIAGGCELSLIVGIDFTASNGECHSPVSLHYLDPSGVKFNQYQDVIRSVGSILQLYDSDQMYPVYGFGARVRLPDGTQSPAQHCFPVYGGGYEVHGVEGILQAYRDAVPSVVFAGPTLFAPIIQNATQIASSKGCDNVHQNYTILLIITDGVINDLELTKSAIINASLQPLSIIIVGVGNADFSEMEILDSDEKLLTSNGRTAVRDIIQFVSYRDVANKGASALAHQVLAEIPSQFLQYMSQNKVSPLPRTVSMSSEITAVGSAPSSMH